MKLRLSQLAALLLPVTAAVAQDGVLKLPVKKSNAVDHILARRSTDDTVNVVLSNQLVSYMANISVGTPSQELQVILDTGSSDLWFPSSSVCPNTSECPYGSFDSGKSSTYEELAAGDFEIQYADQSGAQGDYFSDVLKVASATLKNFTMALGTNLTNQAEGQISGVLGISYVADESSVSNHYPNFPQELVAQGAIKTPAYSLYLDDLNSNTGSILFGGIDTAKFKGELQILDIQPIRNVYAMFNVVLNSVSFNDSGSTTEVSSGSALAILDSGTSFTIVPKDVFSNILESFGDITVTESQGNYYLPCSAGNSGDRSFTFEFGNSSTATITVDLSQFLIQSSRTMCILGFDYTTDDSYTLGDTFLRSVYAVYDLANNQIGVAQANFDTSSSHVVPFESKGAKITDTKGTGSATSTSATSSAGATGTDGAKSAAIRLSGLSVPASSFAAAIVMLLISLS